MAMDIAFTLDERRSRALLQGPLHIFDCDNVLSDDGWRIKHIDWEQNDLFLRYDKYHQLSYMDEPGRLDLIPNDESFVVVFTAMPEFYRETRAAWLTRVGARVDVLVMRRDGDFRPSAEIKREMLRGLLQVSGRLPSQITCAYDDHEEVVHMYRGEGVFARHVRVHETCAFTNRKTGAKAG